MAYKKIAVIGLGQFGATLALHLTEAGHEVIAIDTDPETISRLAPDIEHIVQQDMLDEGAMEFLGLDDCDIIVVAIGDTLAASVLTCLKALKLGGPTVVARAQDADHAEVLTRLGAHRVILPEAESARHLADRLTYSGITDYFALSPSVHLVECSPLPEWVGKTLRDTNIRAKYGLNIVAIERTSGTVASPGPDEVIFEGDLVMAIGSAENVERFSKRRG